MDESTLHRTRFNNAFADLVQTPDEDSLLDIMDGVEDDRLRLIFTCCHPALSPSTQVALTLREICGLKTEEIASAFLSTPPTIAPRGNALGQPQPTYFASSQLPAAASS